MTTRRQFLTHSCALGVALPTSLGALSQLGLSRHAAAQSATDYRALICVLLAGGNDSYNMVLPFDTDAFAGYQSVRSDLALNRGDLLPLASDDAEGRRLALHPAMGGLRALIDQGDAVLLNNVGTLLEPFSGDPSQRLPLGLFSHLDQINQWQTAIMDARSARGWGGRMADRLSELNLANGISMNISLSGSNLFQAGVNTDSYAIDTTDEGAAGLNGYAEDTDFGRFRRSAVDALLGTEPTHVMRREYQRRLRSALDGQAVFADALRSSVALTTEFGTDPFSQALRQVARVISVRDALGTTRQTFFVTVGGWDHHDEVLDNQARMLPAISDGLVSLRDALTELGVFDQVTTFTMSDFGRTLTSNGRGSDHGWGGHHVIMGGAVQGGPAFGLYPDITATSPLDVGRGIYAPTTSVDEYFAELALWFGVAPSELDQVLPNVRRFYTPSASTQPLGFLAG